MPDPDRDESEVTRREAMYVAVQLEGELTVEDVERLFEGVQVAGDPAARRKRPDRDLAMDGALPRPDQNAPGEAR